MRPTGVETSPYSMVRECFSAIDTGKIVHRHMEAWAGGLAVDMSGGVIGRGLPSTTELMFPVFSSLTAESFSIT